MDVQPVGDGEDGVPAAPCECAPPRIPVMMSAAGGRPSRGARAPAPTACPSPPRSPHDEVLSWHGGLWAPWGKGQSPDDEEGLGEERYDEDGAPPVPSSSSASC